MITIDPSKVDKIFEEVFHGQFNGRKSYMQRKLRLMKDSAITWHGGLIIDQIRANI